MNFYPGTDDVSGGPGDA